jgi:uncharacterized protein
MKTLPIRLTPGEDLRPALEAVVAAQGCRAAFVLAGIGSLSQIRIRYAGAPDHSTLSGDLEILTLAGTVASTGSHLHAALSDASGAVFGGHLGTGCIVRTTAEVLLALLPEWMFSRETDAATGYAELVIREIGASK